MNKSNTPQASILIVDDTPANLRLLAQMLSQQGYRLRIAEDGARALESVRANRPDLMLLDVMMPGMNGYEVCAQLKADEATRDIPIIFISALDDTRDKLNAFTAGGVDYVTKPFHLEEVLARIETHLALRDLQKRVETANAELERANDWLEKRVQERTAELVALNTAYERFVPREFLDYLHKPSVVDIRLGDQVQQDMTIMFADIQGFTPRAERMTPQESFNFLNNYFGRVSPLIRQFRGIIDKYLGDGVLALFPESAEGALQAAIAIQQTVADFNLDFEANGEPLLNVGIGLHTGRLILGIIGDNQRMEGTVISDVVNTAARLEELCKIYGASVIASAEMLERLPDPSKYHYRFVDRLQVRGKENWASVFEILDGQPHPVVERKLKTGLAFDHGLHLYYAGEFDRARDQFSLVLGQNPDDQAARLYLRRCSQLEGTFPGSAFYSQPGGPA
ncbi:MAG: response regulator [Anaerolineae bacterium]